MYFKVSDKDESLWDLNGFLEVKLKNDNVQSFETIIAMKKQPDEAILENSHYSQR